MFHDITQKNGVNLHICAIDITITCVGADPTEIKDYLNGYLKDFLKWTEDWGLLLNVQKTVVQHFTRKKVSCPPNRIKINLITY